MKRVSVIIPTRNSQATLTACLRSLKVQSFDELEIIVADNYSNDQTPVIARDFGCIVHECGPSPGQNSFFTAPLQRRIGADMASGEFLFFVDSDMVIPSRLIESCVMKCEEDNADAVVVPEVSFGEGFWSKCKKLERLCYLHVPAIEAPRFVRSDSYRKVGGWTDTAGAFDDWAFFGRLVRQRSRISRCDTNLWHSEGKLTMTRLFRKKYNMGKTLDEKGLVAGGTASMMIQLSPLRYLLLLRTLKLARRPSTVLGVFLMKIVEGLGLMLGRIIG